MRILLDTNIFLEIILDQKNANEAKKLLSLKGEHDYFVTDYSIHSIGLILYRREQHDVFDKFINDMVEAVGIETVVVPTQEMQRVSENAKKVSPRLRRCLSIRCCGKTRSYPCKF